MKISQHNYIIIGLVVLVIVTLVHSIYLVLAQQKTLNELDASLDRIIINVDLLESNIIRKIKNAQEMQKLEEQTAEELMGY